MDWFKFYVGDYARDTGDLSPLEHGLYLRLMLHYYSTEKPLPDDDAKLLRIAGVGAREKRKIATIRGLLARFFCNQSGYWSHARIEKEILKYQERSATNRRNVVDGRYTNRAPDPEARSQIPEVKDQSPNGDLSGAAAPRRNGVNGHHYMEQAEKVIQWCAQKARKNWQARSPNGKPTATADLVVARLKEGYTERQCMVVFARKFREWSADDKMAEYARPATVFRKSHFAEYLAQCGTNPAEE